MHSSGSITMKFGPSWKQSTGHTSTQSVYLHLMQFSVTTKGMEGTRVRWRGHFSGLCASCVSMPLWARLQPRALAPSPAKAGEGWEIGRAHVCTPVTNAHLVCRLLLEKKQESAICTLFSSV